MIIEHETCLDMNPSLPESTQLNTLVTNVVETRGFGILGSFFPGFCCCYSVCILKIGQVMSFVPPLLMESQELS